MKVRSKYHQLRERSTKRLKMFAENRYEMVKEEVIQYGVGNAFEDICAIFT